MRAALAEVETRFVPAHLCGLCWEGPPSGRTAAAESVSQTACERHQAFANGVPSLRLASSRPRLEPKPRTERDFRSKLPVHHSILQSQRLLFSYASVTTKQ